MSSSRFAIIGPPFSGKSTLFTAITGLPPDPALAASERLATVKVPDPRLDFLATLYSPKKYTEALMDFVDCPGLPLDDARGQAQFRKMAQTLRTCSGLVVVVRAFASDVAPPYRDRIDPAADLAEIHSELIFADLEQVVNRIERLGAQIKKGGKTVDHDKKELAFFERVQSALEGEKPVRSVVNSEEEGRIVASFCFLTLMPMVVVINVGESGINSPPPFQHEHAQGTIVLSAEIEAEIARLDPADRPAFAAEMGISESASARMIRACYGAAGLMSFLTAGPEEVRAWTIPKGSSAVEAAGKIHSDIARGFIRAETVAYDDLKTLGDMKAVKAKGKARLEGKEYVVQDGDVILFRFNV